MSDMAERLNAALEGRYRIERELGEGGMATVYLADDLKHNRKVALKVLKPELAAVVGAERFLAEIKTTANRQHPHILPLFDSGEVDGFVFYVMPFVEGESLRDRLDREKQLGVKERVWKVTRSLIQRGSESAIQGLLRLNRLGLLVIRRVWKVVLAKYIALSSRSDHFMRREIREIAAEIGKEGTQDEQDQCRSRGFSGGIRATDFQGGARPEVFGPSTIIVSGGQDGGRAVWSLDVPNFVRKHLIDMTLKIETVRTHGILHTPVYDLRPEGAKFRRKARIFVNDELVDSISLVKPHPHGEDYGVDTRRPFPIHRLIDRDNSTQTVRVEVDEHVLWDIDRVTLKPILLRKELRPWVWMMMGALVSALVGAWVSWLVSS